MTAPVLGPLTTIFTPPSSCFGLTSTNSYSQLWLGFGTDCGPKSSATGGFYSPGICPSGYTSACQIEWSSLYSGEGNSITEITLGKGELGHRCCPSGFTCLSSDWVPYVCQATFLPPTTVPYWESGHFASTSVVVEVGGYSTAQIRAICVKWKAEDLSLFPTAVAATLERSEPLPSSTLGEPMPTSPTSATSSATNSGRLPKSAKVVLGVLIPIVFISLLVSFFLYFRHHRRHRNRPADPNPGQQMSPLDMMQEIPETCQAPSYGNTLSFPILPAGADLSMGQEPVWNPDAELPVPERDMRSDGGLGHAKKLRGREY